MKPAWDSLMREYEGHPSVLIGDVDCTQHQDLCSDMGVGGYPTIKYWTDGAGKEVAAHRAVSVLRLFARGGLVQAQQQR